MENSRENIRALEIQTKMANIQITEAHGRKIRENVREKISN